MQELQVGYIWESAAPEYKISLPFTGIDTPTQDELDIHKMILLNEIADYIAGLSSVGFLSIDGLIEYTR